MPLSLPTNLANITIHGSKISLLPYPENHEGIEKLSKVLIDTDGGWKYTETPVEDEEAARDHIQTAIQQRNEMERIPLVMVDNETGSWFGVISLLSFNVNHGLMVVGRAFVHSDFRGDGRAADALRLLVNWVFEHVEGCRLLITHSATENHASLKSLQKIGFILNGVTPEYMEGPDGAYDLAFLSLLRKNWASM